VRLKRAGDEFRLAGAGFSPGLRPGESGKTRRLHDTRLHIVQQRQLQQFGDDPFAQIAILDGNITSMRR